MHPILSGYQVQACTQIAKLMVSGALKPFTIHHLVIKEKTSLYPGLVCWSTNKNNHSILVYTRLYTRLYLSTIRHDTTTAASKKLYLLRPG
jgi:hypothetical protein